MAVYRCDISDTAINTALTFSVNAQLSSPNMPKIRQRCQRIERLEVDVAAAKAVAADAVAVVVAVTVGVRAAAAVTQAAH